MFRNSIVLGSSLYVFIAGCAPAQESETVIEPSVPQPVERPSNPTEANDCPVLENGNWKAWINRMPGAGEPTLNISGSVTLPSAGYTVAVSMGPLDRRQPPTQILNLQIASPDGPALQALTEQDVSAQFPALASQYRAIIVSCAGSRLAEITEIETAQ